MIATEDIGAAAADALLKLDFSGHETRELQGQRDLTYAEAARSSARRSASRIWHTCRLPREQVTQVLSSIGFSQNLRGADPGNVRRDQRWASGGAGAAVG